MLYIYNLFTTHPPTTKEVHGSCIRSACVWHGKLIKFVTYFVCYVSSILLKSSLGHRMWLGKCDWGIHETILFYWDKYLCCCWFYYHVNFFLMMCLLHSYLIFNNKLLLIMSMSKQINRVVSCCVVTNQSMFFCIWVFYR